MRLQTHFLLLIGTVTSLVGLLFSMFVLYFFFTTQQTALQNSQEAFNEVVKTASSELDEIGKSEVWATAERFRVLVDYYLKSNPDATVESLLHDATFEELRQNMKIGRTGYVATFQVDNLLFIGHPNKSFVGKLYFDIEILKDPKFNEINAILRQLFDTQQTTEGVYDWIDPDGIIRRKYLAAVVSTETTKDDKHIVAMATTYLDEFNFSKDRVNSIFSQKMRDVEVSFEETFKTFLSMVMLATPFAIFIVVLVSYLGYRQK